MYRDYIIYLGPLILSLLITGGVCVYAWRRRQVPGAYTFFFVAVNQLVWIFGFICEYVSPTIVWKLRWEMVEDTAAMTWAVLFVVFAVQYARIKLQRPRLAVTALATPGVIFLLLVYTNSYHYWAKPMPKLVPGTPFSEMTYPLSPLMLVMMFVYLSCVFGGVLILISKLLNAQRLFRTQIAVIILGSLLPLVAVAFAISDLRVGPHRDITPFTCGISNLIIAWGLFRYRFFDLVPIGRDLVVDNLDDIMILVDHHNRVLDLNPVALKIVGGKLSGILGRPVTEVFQPWKEVIDRFIDQESVRAEVQIEEVEYHDLRIIPVREESGRLLGRLVTLRNITPRREAEAILRRSHAELEELVTERTRALTEVNDALRESEERYRVLFDNAAEGILVAEVESRRFLYANSVICRMLDYSDHDLKMLRVEDIHPAEEIGKVVDIFNQLARGEIDVAPEVHCLRRDGKTFYADIRAGRATIEGVVCNIGFFTDATERRESERALRESEARYRLLADNVTDLIWSTDFQLKTVYLSPSVEALRGYTAEEAIKQQLDEIVAPSSISLLTALIKDEIEGWVQDPERQKRTRTMELELLRKDGGTVWTETTARIISSPDGRPVGLVGVTRDITARKALEAAERERLLANQRLQQAVLRIATNEDAAAGRSDEALRFICEVAAEIMDVDTAGVWHMSEDGSEIVCANVFSRPGHSHSGGQRLSVDRHSAYFSALSSGRAVDAADAVNDPRTREFKDDYLLPQGVTAMLDAPVRGLGRVTGALCLEHCGTIRNWMPEEIAFAGEVADQVAQVWAHAERRRLEDQLLQAQKMEAVGRLAGGVAHDFNNQLMVILTTAELISRQFMVGDPRRHHVDLLRQAAEQSAALVRQLLAFSRKQVVEPVVLDANLVINNLARMLRRLLGEDVRLSLILQADPALVRIDPVQIEQAVINLSVNARDAMPSGGDLVIETANVFLDDSYARSHTLSGPGPHIMIAVSDTGAGMDEPTRLHVFEPFFTTKERGKGTGLGLSTVYGIIKQAGGEISVYSEPAHGSTFKIYLPLMAPAGAEAPGIVPDADRGEAVSPGATVLVAEDNDAVREITVRGLEIGGYRVLSAPDGQTAVKVFEEHPEISLLITDLIMPRMSGKELAARLTVIRPGIRVIFLSGYTDNILVHHGILDPGINFLQKPFSIELLLNKVREVIAK